MGIKLITRKALAPTTRSGKKRSSQHIHHSHKLGIYPKEQIVIMPRCFIGKIQDKIFSVSESEPGSFSLQNQFGPDSLTVNFVNVHYTHFMVMKVIILVAN